MIGGMKVFLLAVRGCGRDEGLICFIVRCCRWSLYYSTAAAVFLLLLRDAILIWY